MFLYNNILEGIPLTVTEMTNLTLLDVSNNQLRIFPSTLCNLVNLSHLYLRNNEIGDEDFPKDMRGLLKLRDLNLSGNRMRTLPPSLFHLEGESSSEKTSSKEFNQMCFLHPKACATCFSARINWWQFPQTSKFSKGSKFCIWVAIFWPSFHQRFASFNGSTRWFWHKTDWGLCPIAFATWDDWNACNCTKTSWQLCHTDWFSWAAWPNCLWETIR